MNEKMQSPASYQTGLLSTSKEQLHDPGTHSLARQTISPAGQLIQAMTIIALLSSTSNLYSCPQLQFKLILRTII